ncbi:MAG TPA: isocitrate/isopropylmalate family dehydrogenase [Actinomycetota bacterium]|nr:isocitrate/isopropylmalate family dehydrogenase [Actinomycetota bacterium]
MTLHVTVLPGDGIGREVIPRALEELPSDVEITEIPASAERYLDGGVVLTDVEIDTIRSSDALLFGAVGDPRVPDGVLERGVILRLRKELDLYANVRPFPELDLVIVRENTQGAYSGVGVNSQGSALEVSVNTADAIERCAEYAFSLAETRRGHVTLVHKTNVMVHAGALWREVTSSVAARHPDAELAYAHADAAAYHLVRDHGRFDVILTDNLFGDLLADVAAGVGDGLGAAASANLHPNRSTRPGRCVGMFEPVHGSAPDIAGTGTADPRAAIAAARMMLVELDLATVAS